MRTFAFDHSVEVRGRAQAGEFSFAEMHCDS